MNEAVVTRLPRSPSVSVAGSEISIVVPTFNERDNVHVLLQRLDAALAGISWEVIFVDDNSPDGTWDVIRTIAAHDARVRCLRRVGRRGLAGACIEGILASSAPFVAVIDADLQHDETLIARMLAALREDRADIVVGSRYVSGGNAVSFSGRRLAASLLSSLVARRLLRVEIADPLSGFFMIRRDCFELLAPSLSIHGFKILLDIIASARGKLRVVELPYVFGSRLHGESKLGSLVVLDFLGLVLAKLTRDAVSLRFVLFALIGAVGLLVHLVALYVAIGTFNLSFAHGQLAAAIVAMASNFILNNRLTYHDMRLTGVAFVRGLVLFWLICSVGVLANVGVAFSLYGQQPIWWLAGAAGALIGVTWNYAMTSLFVWQTR